MGRPGHATRRRAAPWAAPAIVLFASVLAGLAAPAAARTSRTDAALAPADSLAARGQGLRALAFADSLLRDARARGDSALVTGLRARRVINWVSMGRFDDALTEARSVAAAARAARDSVSWGRALLAEGRAQLFRSRLADAAPPYRRLLALATPLGDPVLEGNARLGLAYLDLLAGRRVAAESGYRRAIALLERTRDTFSEMTARVGLARVQRERGHVDEARRSYRRILERCRATGDRLNEADAWNNLGAIEAAEGEPAKAAENFARSLQISRSLGRASAQEVRNLAVMLVEAGRVAAAAETLRAELARRPRASARETFVMRTQLALVQSLLGRQEESERLLRAQWALRDSVAVDDAAEVGRQLADLASLQHRDEDALAFGLELERWCAGRLGAESEFTRRLQLAELLRLAGRPAEALEKLRTLREPPFEAYASSWRNRIDLDLQWSRSYLALGRPDSAIATVRRAGETWERTISGLRDAEWFEPAGNSASQIAVQAARALLDPRRDAPEPQRAREAFDAVQRFKSRALDWRARRANAPAGRLVTAGELQARVLKPGEVFVDSYTSRNESGFVFVVDREGVGVHVLSTAGEDVTEQVRALAVLISTDEAGAAFRPAAARRLATWVFGPELARLKRARRIVASMSAGLNALPLAALPADTLTGALLGEGRTVTSVPSASWLALARRTAPANVEAARVVTVARTTDDRGQALAGVRDETRWLAARFGATGVVHAGERPLADVLPWVSRGDVLHVSAHARTSIEDPWGSAFLLGRGEGEDAWLSARALASRRIPARLAVLASCRSNLDRGFGNESVLGLARAFLAAGVPTVISTIWPVDDVVTAAFSRRFYAALEQGRSAADALRLAQEETRRAPGTAAPYYWAGFLVSGDPDTRARPRRAR